MHFLIGLGILAGLVWFAFGAGAARAIVGVVLALPVLAILIFITGEATRGGPDDVPFGKLGHRVTVDQPAAAEQWQAELKARDAELAAKHHAAEEYDAIAEHQQRYGFPALGSK